MEPTSENTKPKDELDLASELREAATYEVNQCVNIHYSLLISVAEEIDRLKWALLQIANGAPGPKHIAKAALEA